MQQYSSYLPVIIQGTIGVLTLMLSGLFYFNYSREKAKNQATKEDIKEITREVESAKKEFIDKTEELKAELSLTNQHKLSWKAAEREAIIDFNRKLSSWIYFIYGFRLRTYNTNNFKDLLAQNLEIRKKHDEFNNANFHLNLFLNDSSFEKRVNMLLMAVIEYSETLKSGMVTIFSLYNQMDNFGLNKENRDSYNEGAIYMHQKIERLIAETNSDIENLLTIQYNNVIEKNKLVREIIQDRLKVLHG